MDSDGQLTFEDNLLSLRYKAGVQHVVRYDFERALEEFRSLKPEFDSPNLDDTIRALEFWVARLPLLRDPDPDKSLTAWRNTLEEFERRSETERLAPPELRDQLRRLALSKIADLLIGKFQRLDVPDPELLKQLGEVFLELKDYRRAAETLLYAVRLAPSDPVTLGLLSDAVHFLGETSRSRLYLREAFLADPDAVPVERLKSPLVRELRRLTEAKGHSGRDLKRWMPVVAESLNLFDAKRALTPEEADRLEAECRDLEDRMAADPRSAERLKPLILFRTLLLMDQALIDGQPHGGRLAACELRLKRLDKTTYDDYLNHVLFQGAHHDP